MERIVDQTNSNWLILPSRILHLENSMALGGLV